MRTAQSLRKIDKISYFETLYMLPMSFTDHEGATEIKCSVFVQNIVDQCRSNGLNKD